MSELDYQDYRAGYVAVVGRPNVGKSTLINALLGQKIAAVSPKPQTTRRNQLGILNLDEAQIIFTDTPGLHKERNRLGELMNNEALKALKDADLILFIVDAASSPQEEDQMLGEVVAANSADTPILLLLNKIDLIDPLMLEDRKEEFSELVAEQASLPVSASEGRGLDELLAAMLPHLPEGPPFYPPDQITDLYERQIAADLIREAALHLLHEEVPHGIAVRIDEFVERGNEGALIEATMLVEKESHKGIVIGKGGAMIKAIGTAARKEIEKMSDRKIFLQLRVKVRKDWRDDENVLSRFGYSSNSG